MTEFLKKNIEMSDTSIPNCFAFKVKIEDKFKTCICPRINEKWSEDDIFYIENEDEDELFSRLNQDLDNEYFNIIFLNIIPDKNNKPQIVTDNPTFLKSYNLKSIELYNEGRFFDLVEMGFMKCYFNKELENSEEKIEIQKI